MRLPGPIALGQGVYGYNEIRRALLATDGDWLNGTVTAFMDDCYQVKIILQYDHYIYFELLCGIRKKAEKV